METIKQLPEKFTGRGEVKGFDFCRICKTKWAFCYQVSLNRRIAHYEVFRRKINKRFDCESYPSSNAFGIWPRTFNDPESAKQKLIIHTLKIKIP